MAEGGEKTEMPTPKKLRDAREKGQVCNSRDISSTALLLVLFVVTAAMTPILVKDLKNLFELVSNLLSGELEKGINEGMGATAILIIKHSVIFCGIAALTGVAANLAQVGFLFAGESLKPDLNKINPFEGAKKIFSMKNLFEFAKNVVKVCFLGFLLYKVIEKSIPLLITLCYGELENAVLPVLNSMMKDLAIYTAVGYILIAVVDWFFQQKNYMKQMMMTKDEVKREYKEMEGSGEVKQAQKQFAQEILNGPDPAQQARQSTVVVTNPTHFAVGIYYEAGKIPLPKVTVKGTDERAKIIRDAAAEEQIPVIENVPLARALYRDCEAEDFIPENLLEPVVEVLKMVKELEQARKEREEMENIILEDELNEEDMDDELSLDGLDLDDLNQDAPGFVLTDSAGQQNKDSAPKYEVIPLGGNSAEDLLDEQDRN